MTEEELLELSENIREAKKKKDKLEARKDVLHEELRNRFGVESLAEAQDLIKTMEKETKEADAKIKAALDKLEKMLYHD